MTQIDWENGTDGQWGTAANWVGGVIPNSGTADVTIAVSGTYTISLESGATYTVDSVTFDNGSANVDLLGTLDLSGSLASYRFDGAVFTLGSSGEVSGGTLNIDGGTLINQGGMIAAADFTLGGNATLALNGGGLTLAGISELDGVVEGNGSTGNNLIITGNATLGEFSEFFTLQNDATLVDSGTVTNTGVLSLGEFDGLNSGETTTPSESSSLVITTGAIFNMAGGDGDPYFPGNYIESSGAGEVSNAGLFEVTGLEYVGGFDQPPETLGAEGEVDVSFDNTGTILVAAGDLLELTEGGTLGGTLAGGDIVINGNFTLAPSLVNISADLTIYEGTLAGDLTLGGTVEFGDEFDLAGHTLSLSDAGIGNGGGDVEIDGPGLLRITGSASIYGAELDRGAIIEDAGSISQSGDLQAGPLSPRTGTLLIDAKAVYDLQTESNGAGDIGIGTVLNVGLFEVTGIGRPGIGPNIYAFLGNTGTLAVNAGALTLQNATRNDNLITVTNAEIIAIGSIGNDAGDHGMIEITNGTLAAQSLVSAGQTIALAGTDALDIVLGDFAATITGFTASDVIDLTGTKVNGESYANNVLTLTEALNGNPASLVGTLNLIGVMGTIALQNDTQGGTEILLNPAGPVDGYPTVATTSIWNAGSGDFGNAANWLPVGVPGISATALITNSSSITISSAVSETIYQLENTDSAAEILITGGAFTVEEANYNNGSYSDGAVVIAGGKFEAIRGFTFDNTLSLATAGTLEVDNGALQLAAGGTLGGTLLGGGTLALQHGDVLLNASLSPGNTLIDVAGAAVTLAASENIAAPFLLAAGVFDLNGHNLTLSGTSTLGSSVFPTISGHGSVIVTGTMQLDDLDLQNNATLVDAGTILDDGYVLIGINYPATDTSAIVIDSGAIYDILDTPTGAGGINAFNVTSHALTNTGLLEVTGAGDDTFAFNALVVNTGTILVAAGALQLGILASIGTMEVVGVTLAGTLAGSGVLELQGDVLFEPLQVDVATLNVFDGVLELGANELFGGTLTEVSHDGSAEAFALNGYSLTLAGSSVLNGDVSGNGSAGNDLIISGHASIANASPTIDQYGDETPVFVQIGNNATLIDAGTITQVYGLALGDGDAEDNSSLVIDAGATYLLGSDPTFSDGLFPDIEVGDSGSVQNAGLFEAGLGSGNFGGGVIDGAFSNTGTVLVNADGDLQIYSISGDISGNGSISNIADGTLSGGTWEVSGVNAELDLDQDAPITTDAANIILAGIGSEIYTGFALATIESSLNSIAATGTLQNIDGRSYSTANTITDSGIIVLAGTLAAAAISITSTGLLEGSGTVDAPVRNDGTIDATGSLILADAVTGNGIIDVGGEVIVEGSIAAGETFGFLNDSGTLALLTPSQFGPNGFGSLTSGISGLRAGDVLELAGTAVSAISFGSDTLSVTTSSGIYDFTDVSYGGAVNGYSVAMDASTGLQAITFTDTLSIPPVIIAPGRTASYQTIGSGGSEFLTTGDVVNVSTIAAGGVQEVLPGGTVNYSVIEGGVLGVAGTANRAQVESGGYEVVQPGGKSVDTSIFAGGYEYVLGNASAIDSIIAYHGTMLVSAGGTASGSVNFTGSDAVLSVGGTVLPSATLEGFDQRNTHDDAIILTGFTYASGLDTATLGAGGVLTLDLNGAIEKLDFDPAQSNAGHSFAITANSLDQVVIIDPITGSTPNMAFLAPATAAGSAGIFAAITGASSALLAHVSNTGSISPGFQTALKNFAAIDTLDKPGGAAANLLSLNAPLVLSAYKFNAHA